MATATPADTHTHTQTDTHTDTQLTIFKTLARDSHNFAAKSVRCIVVVVVVVVSLGAFCVLAVSQHAIACALRERKRK